MSENPIIIGCADRRLNHIFRELEIKNDEPYVNRLAGGTLALTSRDKESRITVLEKNIHLLNSTSVILTNHTQCKAYRFAFPPDYEHFATKKSEISFLTKELWKAEDVIRDYFYWLKFKIKKIIIDIDDINDIKLIEIK